MCVVYWICVLIVSSGARELAFLRSVGPSPVLQKSSKTAAWTSLTLGDDLLGLGRKKKQDFHKEELFYTWISIICIWLLALLFQVNLLETRLQMQVYPRT